MVQDARRGQVLQGGQRREHTRALVCDDRRAAQSDTGSRVCRVPWLHEHCVSGSAHRADVQTLSALQSASKGISGTRQQMDPCPMSESSCCMPGAMQIHALRQVLQAEALLQPLMQRQYTGAAAPQQQQVTSSQGACRQIRRGHPYSEKTRLPAHVRSSCLKSSTTSDSTYRHCHRRYQEGGCCSPAAAAATAPPGSTGPRR